MRLLVKLLVILALVADWRARAQSLRGVLTPLGLDPSQVTYVVGDSPEAKSFGFLTTDKRVTVRGLAEARQPALQIVWEEPLEVPVFEMPAGATVFTRERWTGAPLAAGLMVKGKAVLWTAVSPGVRGFERFPYLPQA